MAKYIIRNIKNEFDADSFPTLLEIEQQVLNNNYVGIEVLIAKTKDDQFIVVYSDKLKDAFGKILNVQDLTLSEIKLKFSDVLLLKQLLQDLKTNKIILITPICGPNCEETYKKVSKFIEEYDNLNVNVQVFSEKELSYINFKNPKHKKGLYVDSVPNIQVLETDLNFFNINNDLINKDTVASLVANNYDVFTSLVGESSIEEELKLKDMMQELYDVIYIIKSI